MKYGSHCIYNLGLLVAAWLQVLHLTAAHLIANIA